MILCQETRWWVRDGCSEIGLPTLSILVTGLSRGHLIDPRAMRATPMWSQRIGPRVNTR
jgi:hypothetical protein